MTNDNRIFQEHFILSYCRETQGLLYSKDGTEHHLQYTKENPQSVNYLLLKIQNELIAHLAGSVRSRLINQIESAKYYVMMFDSTPDLGHREQMLQVIRYVDIDYTMQRLLPSKNRFLAPSRSTRKQGRCEHCTIYRRQLWARPSWLQISMLWQRRRHGRQPQRHTSENFDSQFENNIC